MARIQVTRMTAIVGTILLNGLAGVAMAQGLPGSGTGSIGDNWNYWDNYVGSGSCFSSCIGIYTGTTEPTWQLITKGPYGQTTNNRPGVAMFDEDGDGDEEVVDTDIYIIEAEVVGIAQPGDGSVHITIAITVTNRLTNDTETIHSETEVVQESDIRAVGN